MQDVHAGTVLLGKVANRVVLDFGSEGLECHSHFRSCMIRNCASLIRVSNSLAFVGREVQAELDTKHVLLLHELFNVPDLRFRLSCLRTSFLRLAKHAVHDLRIRSGDVGNSLADNVLHWILHLPDINMCTLPSSNDKQPFSHESSFETERRVWRFCKDSRFLKLQISKDDHFQWARKSVWLLVSHLIPDS